MSRIKIAIDRPKSEHEIHAEAVTLLKEALGAAYIVRAEYTFRNCRFDIAVFRADDRELVCTIEIKKRGGVNKHHKQTNRYQRATGKPCVLLTEATMRVAIGALKTRLAVSP